MLDGVESASFLAKASAFLARLPWSSKEEVSWGTCSRSWRASVPRATRLRCGLLWTHWGYFNVSPSSWPHSVIICSILIAHQSRFSNSFCLVGGHITDFIAGLVCLFLGDLGEFSNTGSMLAVFSSRFYYLQTGSFGSIGRNGSPLD